MWLFAKRGFVSIVTDPNDPARLMVRSRFEGDIEKLFGKCKVTRTPERDYLYRASLPRKKVAKVAAQLVQNIDYGNFKDAAGPSRHMPYMRVWTAMYQAGDARRLPAQDYLPFFDDPPRRPVEKFDLWPPESDVIGPSGDDLPLVAPAEDEDPVLECDCWLEYPEGGPVCTHPFNCRGVLVR